MDLRIFAGQGQAAGEIVRVRVGEVRAGPVLAAY
jgi:hypothetical protein